ncbi:MAG: metallophosphoesterase family protein [Anaerolineae bacterium]
MTMRLAVFSDIHGNLTALDAVLNDLDSVGAVDQIWCLGDVVAWGTRPTECVARLRALQDEHGDERFKLIGGNTDRYLVTGKRPSQRPAQDESQFTSYQVKISQRDALLNWAMARLSWDDYEFLSKTIGRELYKQVDGYGDVIGFHGIPGDDDGLALRPDSPQEEAQDALLDRAGRLALAGHTHLVMDRALGDWRVINPGSVGLSFTNPRFAEWALLTFEGDSVTVDFRTVGYDLQAVIADMDTVRYPHPEWLLGFINK